MVSRLRQRALVTGPMDEDRGLTCAINWDDWHESLRSDLLRRAEAARHHPDAGWLCRRAPAAMRLPWPTWLHQPSPRRVQSSMALARSATTRASRDHPRAPAVLRRPCLDDHREQRRCLCDGVATTPARSCDRTNG